MKNEKKKKNCLSRLSTFSHCGQPRILHPLFLAMDPVCDALDGWGTEEENCASNRNKRIPVTQFWEGSREEFFYLRKKRVLSNNLLLFFHQKSNGGERGHRPLACFFFFSVFFFPQIPPKSCYLAPCGSAPPETADNKARGVSVGPWASVNVARRSLLFCLLAQGAQDNTF